MPHLFKNDFKYLLNLAWTNTRPQCVEDCHANLPN